MSACQAWMRAILMLPPQDGNGENVVSGNPPVKPVGVRQSIWVCLDNMGRAHEPPQTQLVLEDNTDETSRSNLLGSLTLLGSFSLPQYGAWQEAKPQKTVLGWSVSPFPFLAGGAQDSASVASWSVSLFELTNLAHLNSPSCMGVRSGSGGLNGDKDGQSQ